MNKDLINAKISDGLKYFFFFLFGAVVVSFICWKC